MVYRTVLMAFVAAGICTRVAGGAIITFTNLADDFLSGWAITDGSGRMLRNGEAKIRLGTSSLSLGQIAKGFGDGQLSEIDKSFLQFGDAFTIGAGLEDIKDDNDETIHGLWLTTIDQSTRESDSPIGGRAIDAWVVIGDDFLSASSEHLYVRFKELFPTDPKRGEGIPQRKDLSLHPSLVDQVVFGKAGQRKHDFELGGGDEEAFSTTPVPDAPIPEPSTGIALVLLAVTMITLRTPRFAT